jgi:hypothetical protein
VTYGDVASRLRDQLTWLLERHRIGQQLGGPGSCHIPVTTTETERPTRNTAVACAVLAY